MPEIVPVQPEVVVEGEFEGTTIQFILYNGEEIASLRNISQALGYTRFDTALRFLNRNMDIFEKHIRKLRFRHHDGDSVSEEITLTEVGTYRFCMKSGTERADRLQEWIANLLKSYRTGQLTLSNPRTREIAIHESIVKLLKKEAHLELELMHTQEEVGEQKIRLNALEAIRAEQPITTPHLEILHGKVNHIAEITGVSHGTIWLHVNEQFKVPKPNSRRSRCSLLLDKDFQAVCNYLDGYLAFTLSQRTLDQFETKKN